jgi:hypothetical protein
MKGHPTNPGCELVELRLFTILPLVLRNMFYRGAAIYHLFVSDPTRVGDDTHIPCNAVPPDRGCLVNPTLKPDRQNRGRQSDYGERQ